MALSNSWFPVLTLLLGFGTKAVADVLQDGRAAKRERENREETHLFERRKLRDDLQRQTMLDLQANVSDMMRLSARALIADTAELRLGKSIKDIKLPEEINEGLRQKQQTITLLTSRLSDSLIREKIGELGTMGVRQGLASTEAEMDLAFRRAGNIADEILRLLGKNIRAIDGFEE